MVGLPASGKSTFIVEMCKIDPDVFVYSTDSILERVAKQLGKTYDDVFEKHIKFAKEGMDVLLAEAIKSGKDVVFDQTNLGVKKRRGIVQRMKKAGYKVNVISFDVPKTEVEILDWNLRLHNRKGKTIPENIIQNMIRSYAEPSLDEGFDEITTFNIYGDLIREQKNDG